MLITKTIDLSAYKALLASTDARPQPVDDLPSPTPPSPPAANQSVGLSSPTPPSPPAANLDTNHQSGNTTPLQVNQPCTLPSSRGFQLLSALSESQQANIVNSLHYPWVDVDKWEIFLSPDQYLTQFGSTLATVQIASQATGRKGKGNQDGEFDDWLLLATSGHQLKIDPRFKPAFFAHLATFRTIQPAPESFRASLGTSHVPTPVFVHCLEKAGCSTLLLKQYGQKLPLINPYLGLEPAQLHPLAHLNQWDIGATYPSPHIWLFSPVHGRSKQSTVYPMLVPGSLDFGSISVDLKYNNKHYRIKIYPRLVHVIKSWNSRLQGIIPNQMAAIRGRAKAGEKVVQSLAGMKSSKLGGFRVEVSVQAKSLAAARTMVNNTPLLDIKTWLNPTHPALRPYKMAVKLVTKQALLTNTNWLHMRAVETGIYQGDHNRKPSSLQIKGWLDVLASFGWNAGTRKITKSLDPHAWWQTPTQDPARQDELKILRHINKLLYEGWPLAALLRSIRKGSDSGQVPCKKNPHDRTHKYHLKDKQNFRLSCANKHCKDHLPKAAAIKWFAHLVAAGVVSRDVIKLRPIHR